MNRRMRTRMSGGVRGGRLAAALLLDFTSPLSAHILLSEAGLEVQTFTAQDLAREAEIARLGLSTRDFLFFCQK